MVVLTLATQKSQQQQRRLNFININENKMMRLTDH